MQLKLFMLPMKHVAAAEAEMNAFLRSHRVLAVSKAQLNQIEGVGEARVEKYGEAVLDLTTKSADLNAETQRRGDAEENDVSEIFAPWRLRVFAFLRSLRLNESWNNNTINCRWSHVLWR